MSWKYISGVSSRDVEFLSAAERRWTSRNRASRLEVLSRVRCVRKLACDCAIRFTKLQIVSISCKDSEYNKDQNCFIASFNLWRLQRQSCQQNRRFTRSWMTRIVSTREESMGSIRLQNTWVTTTIYMLSRTWILLLTDVFERVRESCLATYGLDPVHYYSSPVFSWGALLTEDECGAWAFNRPRRAPSEHLFIEKNAKCNLDGKQVLCNG